MLLFEQKIQAIENIKLCSIKDRTDCALLRRIPFRDLARNEICRSLNGPSNDNWILPANLQTLRLEMLLILTWNFTRFSHNVCPRNHEIVDRRTVRVYVQGESISPENYTSRITLSYGGVSISCQNDNCILTFCLHVQTHIVSKILVVTMMHHCSPLSVLRNRHFQFIYFSN